ncbi:MAG: AraC family transcriptional regulator [Segetibacter sp.]|nr:AraC family transcriptional regulator [Segetibacter sp.]
MSKEKIPVYDICSLSKDKQVKQNDLLVERFGAYLNRHEHSLHHAHRHSFFHLVLFTKGSGTHTIDFDQFNVKPYEIYFMIPGQVHSWHFEGEVDGYIINFSDTLFRSFLLNPNYLERFHFFSGISEESVCQLPIEVHGKVTQLFEEILAQTSNSRNGEIDMIRLLLMQLFLIVENSCNFNNKKSIPQQKQVLLRNFRRLIDQHYLSIKLPKEYADLLYVTPNHLNALCQDLLGKTAGELIRDRILLEAKRLLTNANMTVTEIAYNLNFQDNSYFNRFFKKYVGVTPDEFRKQLVIQ